MRSSFPTREQLGAMSIKSLRLIDIKEGDEEALVQEILNQKVQASPPNVVLNLGTDNTDIKTAEQEAELQKVIDERKAKAIAHLSSTVIQTESAVEPEVPAIEIEPKRTRKAK